MNDCTLFIVVFAVVLWSGWSARGAFERRRRARFTRGVNSILERRR